MHKPGVLLPCLLAIGALGSLPMSGQSGSSPTLTTNRPVAFAVSSPLRELAKMPRRAHYEFEETEPVGQPNFHPGRVLGKADDPVEQKSPGPSSGLSIGVRISGIDRTFCNCEPPDTNAAVGDTQVVEWVNDEYAVYNKTTGALELGPIDGNVIWQSLGGPCFAQNLGDPIVQWDRANHRWLLSQNYLNGGSGGYLPPYYACVAVSTSPDATGTYYEYQFPLTNFPDYQKWGVWPSGYFQTQNAFVISTGQFAGPNVCAYESAKLIHGDPSAQQVCFLLTPNDFSLLPADVDSRVPPPANQDEFLIGSYDVDNSRNHLYLYSMHPDFANPSQSTFSGSGLANPITVSMYTPLCPQLSSPCIPQKDTTVVLDSLGDRLMYRFSYWDDGPLGNIGSTAGRLHQQHWYVNHVTTASSGQAAVRWYELRAPIRAVSISGVSLFQSGTFAPDATNRWMGSIAQDKMGDIALGYSLASASVYDSIGVTGRTPSDSLGQMEAEVVLTAGTGSTGSSKYRWGDYSSMAIDADGCTFWYAQDIAPYPHRSTGKPN